MSPKPYLSGHKASQTHQQALIRCFLRSLRPEQAQFFFHHCFRFRMLIFAHHQNIQSSVNVGWNHLSLSSAIPPSLAGHILLLKRNDT